MPRSRATNQLIRDAKRQRILAAAATVFARQGLAATMGEVAVAAKVSHGLAYRYFRSKDELFRTLAKDALHSSPSPAHVLEMGGTAGERLRHLIATLLDARRADPELFLLLNRVLRETSVPADLMRLAQERSQQFRKALRHLIVEGQASGEVAAGSPDQLVTVLTACLDGLGRLSMTPDLEFPDLELVMRLLVTSPLQQAQG